VKVRSVVFLSPEPPYPLNGGGAFRIASLMHYFARFADVDLILFSEKSRPADLPKGLVRKQFVIPLPVHGKGTWQRWQRNAWRAVRGVPPLVDRLSGLEKQVRSALGESRYDLGIAEHAWCSPYLPLLKSSCGSVLLDLHNVESVLHQRSAGVSSGLIAAGHRRFAGAMRRLEAQLAPQFDFVAATSTRDAELIEEAAPGTRTLIYPNALPATGLPAVEERDEIAFSGNFEYHPNIDAVAFLMQSIWPEVRRRQPLLRLRLIGRGNEFISHIAPWDGSVEMTGPVEDSSVEIARAKIVIAPLRSGSGTRIKILEAWKLRRPVVATRLAAEGLSATDGLNVLFAESANEFADAIDRLQRDADLRCKLSEQGRKIFETAYTWESAWRRLDPLFT
jgi:glycosyltransferase involved in cell wall biosynthesis